jgi:hypothetical protein
MMTEADSVFAAPPDAHLSALVRAEQGIAVLRTRYIREGWQIDHVAAELALSYFRKSAQGQEDDELFQAAIGFLSSHGQSLDWIFDGDISGMICGLAKHSKRAETGSKSSPKFRPYLVASRNDQ